MKWVSGDRAMRQSESLCSLLKGTAADEAEDRASSADEKLVGLERSVPVVVGGRSLVELLWLAAASVVSLVVEAELRRLFRYLLGFGGLSLGSGGPWARNSRLSCLNKQQNGKFVSSRQRQLENLFKLL